MWLDPRVNDTCLVAFIINHGKTGKSNVEPETSTYCFRSTCKVEVICFLSIFGGQSLLALLRVQRGRTDVKTWGGDGGGQVALIDEAKMKFRANGSDRL